MLFAASWHLPGILMLVKTRTLSTASLGSFQNLLPFSFFIPEATAHKSTEQRTTLNFMKKLIPKAEQYGPFCWLSRETRLLCLSFNFESLIIFV